MPSQIINWRAIKARYQPGSTPAGLFFFILPDAARDIYLSVSEALKWRATYRVRGQSDLTDEEFDEVQSIVSSGVSGLIGGVDLNVLLGKLDTLIEAVGDLCECVTTAVGGQPPTFPPGGAPDEEEGPDYTIPPNNDPNGPPFEYPDWPTYLDYKCKAAWFITQVVIDSFNAMSGFGAVATVIAAYIGLMLITFPPAAFVALGAGAIMVIIVTMFALVGYSGWTFDVMGDTAAQLYTGTGTGYGQEAVVCDLYNSTGTTQAAAILRNWVRGATEDTLAGYPDITDVPGATSLIMLIAIKLCNRHLTDGLFREILDVSQWTNTCAECPPAAEEYTLIGGYGFTVYEYTGSSQTVGSFGSVVENIYPTSTHAFSPANPGSTLNYTANVRSDLEDYLDSYPGVLMGGTLQEAATDFNAGWEEPGLQFGVFTNQFNGGDVSLIAMDFKLLCATATNPENWIWLDAYLSTPDDNEESYVVVPGLGQGGTIEIDVTLPDSSSLTHRIHLWPSPVLPDF